MGDKNYVPDSIFKGVSEKYSDYKNGSYFPSDDIDPDEKNGAWCLAWAQALWGLFLNGSCYTSLADNQEIKLMRAYGAGQQPKEIYMDWLLGDLSDNPLREGYLATNWEIFSPMPKYKRIIMARFGMQEYDYSATAIDPFSVNEREDKIWETWYNSLYGEKEAEIMNIIGLPQGSESQYTAKSLEELEMFNEMGGFKLKKEATIEALLELTDYLSDMPHIKDKVINDLIDLNRLAMRDYYDTSTCTMRAEYVDWERLIIDYSSETDFKDIRFWAYLKFATVNDIRVQTGLTESELLKLASPYLGMYGNMNSDIFNNYASKGFKDVNGNIVYNNLRVPYLMCEWLSTDTTYKTVKNGKYYPQERGKIINTKNKKTDITNINNVYTCNWIIGSTFVWNDGPQLNIARPNIKNPRLSIHAIALPGKSITKTIVPNLDQIQLTSVKLQNAMAVAKPQGLKIEIGSLSNIDLGDGELTPIELIKIARQTGDVLYRATTHAGQYTGQANPIDISQGGLGGLLNEFVQNFELNFQFIAELTGIDRLSAASPRGGETTATASKLAVAATTDALQPLYTSYVRGKEDMAICVADKIQRIIRHKPEAYEAYKDVIGSIGIKTLEIAADVGLARFGIKIEIKPTEDIKQMAIQAATEALKPGKDGEKINIVDWSFFMELIRRGRVKHAQALMGYRLNVSREESIKRQEDNMRMNGENMVRQEQEKRKTLEMELTMKGQIEIRKEAVIALLKMQVEDNSAMNKLKQDMIMMYMQPEGGGQDQAAQQPQAQPPEAKIESNTLDPMA